MIYLDNNATTIPLKEVINFFSDNYKDIFFNINSDNKYSNNLYSRLTDLKTIIFKYHGISDKYYDILFTQSATISNKMVLNLYKDMEILTTPYEHKSILENSNKTKTHFIKLDKSNFVVDLEDLETKLKQNKNIGLVSVIAAGNEIPVRNNLYKIQSLCEKYQVAFHTDATQLFGKNLKIGNTFDLLTFSAHKFNGLKGVGGLIYNKMMYNSDQFSQKEYGTPNAASYLSLEPIFLKDDPNMKDSFYRDLRNYFFECIKDIPNYYSIEPEDDRYIHPNTILIDFGLCGINIKRYLDSKDIIISLGSACGSNIAHSLKAINKDHLIGVIRISFGRFTTKDEIKTLADELKKILIKK